MSIEAIEAQIEAVVGTVTEIAATYTYPVADIGRKLPALVILYDDFTQEPGPGLATTVEWGFEFQLFLPAEGKNLLKNWTALKSLVPKILDAFRANPGLNGACWQSIITAGEPVITVSDASEQPRYIGHSFRIVAKQEEV